MDVLLWRMVDKQSSQTGAGLLRPESLWSRRKHSRFPVLVTPQSCQALHPLVLATRLAHGCHRQAAEERGAGQALTHTHSTHPEGSRTSVRAGASRETGVGLCHEAGRRLAAKPTHTRGSSAAPRRAGALSFRKQEGCSGSGCPGLARGAGRASAALKGEATRPWSHITEETDLGGEVPSIKRSEQPR